MNFLVTKKKNIVLRVTRVHGFLIVQKSAPEKNFFFVFVLFFPFIIWFSSYIYLSIENIIVEANGEF